MPAVTTDDLARMRDQLFFEGDQQSRKLSRYWLLLPLAGVIASAGIVADSTATVIGAMIVAPLMTPILGTMLAVVLGDRVNLARSLMLVLLGAASVVAIGFALGLLIDVGVVAPTNAQVTARVSPRLIDLIAALATGAVGSVALARSDISDTLPGVAISISLVPPLAVVGLTAEAGAYSQSLGALLLFVTNVSAILATGIVVMALYGVHRHPIVHPTIGKTLNRRRGIVAIVALVVIVVVPLAGTSANINRIRTDESNVRSAAQAWAEPAGWSVVEVATEADRLRVRTIGPLPEPDPTELRSQLDARGLANVRVEVEMVPIRRVELDPTGGR